MAVPIGSQLVSTIVALVVYKLSQPVEVTLPPTVTGEQISCASMSTTR